MPVLEAESGGEAHVTTHLNDFFAIAHWHDPEDGFVNLEEMDGGDDVETASNGSVIKRGTQVAEPLVDALISEAVRYQHGCGNVCSANGLQEISLLGKLSQQIMVDVDILRYQMNIVAFLRLHRAVAGGISPAATKHLDQLIRCLAPLHSLDFVTPALVAVAVRKVYLHRIRITQPDQERSLYWGSKLEAVEAILQDFGPEDVIEDTLEMVTAPL